MLTGLLAGGAAATLAADGECFRLQVAGEGIVEPAGREAADREAAARQALALAVAAWEAAAAELAGAEYALYGSAQGKAEDCAPLQRNIMSPIRCEVMATPCVAAPRLIQ